MSRTLSQVKIHVTLVLKLKAYLYWYSIWNMSVWNADLTKPKWNCYNVY